METPLTKESMPNLSQLTEYEATNQYLFHGSPHKLDQLIPHQATDTSGDPFKNSTGVFSTPYVVRAIASAILPPAGSVKGPSHVNISVLGASKGISLKCTKNIYDNISSGYVHVISREGSEKHPKENQYRHKEVQLVLSAVKVTPEDFKSCGGVIELIN